MAAPENRDFKERIIRIGQAVSNFEIDYLHKQLKAAFTEPMDVAIAALIVLTRDRRLDPDDIRHLALDIVSEVTGLFPADIKAQARAVPDCVLLRLLRGSPGGGASPLASEWMLNQLLAAVSSGIEYLTNLIGRDLRELNECTWEIARELRNWLTNPELILEFETGQALEMLVYDGFVQLHYPADRGRPVLPGQRRAYELLRGAAVLLTPGRSLPISRFGKVILRGQHFGAATLRHLAATGPGATVKLEQQRFASLMAREYCKIADYICVCGIDTCKTKHRLSGFSPGRHARATLSSFLWSAVKGPLPNPTPTAFATGMLYAHLSSNTVCGIQLRHVPLLRERMRQNPAARYAPYRDAVEAIVLHDTVSHKKMVRCLGVPNPGWNRDPHCDSLELVGAIDCGFCGHMQFSQPPTTVMELNGDGPPVPLDDLAPLADPGLNPEELLMKLEETDIETDWEGYGNGEQE